MHLSLQFIYNFRCFSELTVPLENDVTVVAAENGGGKTALLSAIATQLAKWFNPPPLKLVKLRDQRYVRTKSNAWEGAGSCALISEAEVDGVAVGWMQSFGEEFARRKRKDAVSIRLASERVLVPGRDWPVLAFYGTQRLWQVLKRTRGKEPARRQRLDGYVDCLDPRSSEGQLLEWMKHHAIIDLQRGSRHEARLGQLDAVFASMQRATPGVKEIFYDLALGEPRVLFDDGTEAPWSALSDGYHVFLGLVADIARRAVILNDHLGAEAPLKSSGVVLVDEIDLHLHPKWQRTVVQGLRNAFPNIQFVLTTHSPQVLGSVENRQVRRLVNHQLVTKPSHVHGRDSNAILDDVMGAASRSDEGETRRRALHAAIDDGRLGEATTLLAELKAEWGDLDPAVVYAETSLDWARTTPEDGDARDQER